LNKKMQSKKDVESYYSGDKIECLICGKLFKALATHIVRVHGYTVDGYKQEFNLPWGRGLTSEKTSQKKRDVMLKRLKTDARLKMTPELMAKAQQAKKRKCRDYDIKRLEGMRKNITAIHKQNSYEKAILILDVAEKLNCPACCVCVLPDMPNFHNLYAACKKHLDIKTRYEKLKKDIPRGVELRTDTSYLDLKNEIISLKENGLTAREIAKEFFISKTTVFRALNNQGAFKEIL
jgi:hypothetical protein